MAQDEVIALVLYPPRHRVKSAPSFDWVQNLSVLLKEFRRVGWDKQDLILASDQSSFELRQPPNKSAIETRDFRVKPLAWADFDRFNIDAQHMPSSLLDDLDVRWHFYCLIRATIERRPVYPAFDARKYHKLISHCLVEALSLRYPTVVAVRRRICGV
jgi:hypothetical protein